MRGLSVYVWVSARASNADLDVLPSGCGAVRSLSAYLSINPEMEQGWSVASHGSTAAIHGMDGIRFLELNRLPSVS